MPLIVIDYDKTFTADPDMWIQVIPLMESRGHTVICCTNRVGDKHEDADVIRDMGELKIEIVFSRNQPDKSTAVYNAGYIPENAIWIDDSPHLI